MDPNDCVHHVSQAHYSILNMFSPGRASVPSVIVPATRRQRLADSGPLEVRGEIHLTESRPAIQTVPEGPSQVEPQKATEFTTS
jgi:hypothetical protein